MLVSSAAVLVTATLHSVLDQSVVAASLQLLPLSLAFKTEARQVCGLDFVKYGLKDSL